MKPGRKPVAYLPVHAEEQELLWRAREPDLAHRTAELTAMLDQIASAQLRPADLEQAIELLVASRQGEALEARFENLEARLKERIEKGLSEIEGRLSRRLAPAAPAPAPAAEAPAAPAVAPPRAEPPREELPREASLAFRVEGALVWGPSAAQFYVEIWRWLFDHGKVSPRDLPIPSGRTRHAVAAAPVHPSGKDFFAAHELRPGVWVEAHMSRENVIQRAKKHLTDHGVRFEVVVGAG
jgi:hypothetical protein